MTPFDEWAEAHGITMEAYQKDKRDNADDWHEGASHWLVVIKSPEPNRKPFKAMYSQGSAHRVWTVDGVRAIQQFLAGGASPDFPNGAPAVGSRAVRPYGRVSLATDAHYRKGTRPIVPEIGDVLYCLASDVQGLDWCLDFREWAEAYGYDTDSRKAEATYRKIQEQAADLRATLGGDVYDEMLELEEGADAPWPTLDELRARFAEYVEPHIQNDDTPALDQGWNDWTDMLCKDGEITNHQYNTWTREDA